MTIAHGLTLFEVGRTFAQAVRDEPAVKSLWASAHRDYFELWLVTAPVDADTERRLYGLIELLFEAFPDARIRLHVINREAFEDFELTSIVPRGAENIPLRSS